MDNRLFYTEPGNRVSLTIDLEEDTIISLGFCQPQKTTIPETELEKEIYKQLNSYFLGTLKEFDLPFFATGTIFQLLVWEELMKVPYGETISYGELAKRIGNPKAARVVGSALHNNPTPILIPCHRVVGAKGQLTGFAGGLDVKATLLELEKEYKL